MKLKLLVLYCIISVFDSTLTQTFPSDSLVLRTEEAFSDRLLNHLDSLFTKLQPVKLNGRRLRRRDSHTNASVLTYNFAEKAGIGSKWWIFGEGQTPDKKNDTNEEQNIENKTIADLTNSTNQTNATDELEENRKFNSSEDSLEEENYKKFIRENITVNQSSGKISFFKKKGRVKDKIGNEKCINLAITDPQRATELMLNESTYSHFQDELTSHLNNLLTLMDLEDKAQKKKKRKAGEEETGLDQSSSTNSTLNISKSRADSSKLEDSELYDYFKMKGIKNRLEIKIAPDQEKLNVQDLKDLLKSFDYQLAQQNSYSKQSIFKELAKASNKSLVEKAKMMAEYYWDLDYVLSMIKRLPEFQKKEINFQVLMEFVTFLDSYFNNSRIELLDPEFDITMKKKLRQIHYTVSLNSIEALPFVSESLEKIKRKSRERMNEVKNLIDDPNTYYGTIENRATLHQLIKLPRGDIFLLTDPRKRMIFDFGQRDNDNYTSECMVGFLMKSYQIGTSPVLEYYHKNYKLHYYTTDMNELGSLDKEEIGHGGWSYEGVLGYVFPVQMPSTIPIYKYYNQIKNRFLYTTNPQDMTPSLSGQVCFLRPENNNPLVNKLLGQAFDIGDQFILLGTLGFIYPPHNCWEF